jgi:hypothetical protein
MFISEGNFSILSDLAPNEVKMAETYSEPFAARVPTDLVALAIDTGGRDVELVFNLEQLVGDVWQNIKRDVFAVNEVSSIQATNEVGIFRMRLGVWAGAAGAIGRFSVRVLFMLMPRLRAL